MSFGKQRKLVEVLSRRTAAGEIEWQETLQGVFQVSFKDNSVQLRTYQRENVREPTYLVSLLNSEGEVADNFTDEELDIEQFGSTAKQWFKQLGELYTMALRRARGADQVLDAILREVDDDIPF